MCVGSTPATRLPEVGRLVVARDAVRRVALEDGDVQPRRVELPDLGQQLPRPGDRFLLEVVAEATSCRASRRTCGGRCPCRRRRGRCACRRRGCTSACWPPACTAASPVPRKIGLNWFMPALVNSSVGSSCGTTRRATARTCGRASCTKKSMNCWRISFAVGILALAKVIDTTKDQQRTQRQSRVSSLRPLLRLCGESSLAQHVADEPHPVGDVVEPLLLVARPRAR